MDKTKTHVQNQNPCAKSKPNQHPQHASHPSKQLIHSPVHELPINQHEPTRKEKKKSLQSQEHAALLLPEISRECASLGSSASASGKVRWQSFV